MKLLQAWIFFSALILAASLAIHLSTFLGIDPMQAIPGVMLFHLAIFPPFIAAIIYSNKLGLQKSSQQDSWKLAPQWMRTISGVFFAYAMVNFIIFIILVHGGGPEIRDGKFVLADHGRIIRQLSQVEFHKMQAYVVRGFSGHWMLFSSAAMTLLTGVYNYRNTRTITENERIS